MKRLFAVAILGLCCLVWADAQSAPVAVIVPNAYAYCQTNGKWAACPATMPILISNSATVLAQLFCIAPCPVPSVAQNPLPIGMP